MIEYKVEVYPDGTQKWHLDDKLHCAHGPAIEWASGHKEWWFEGKRHRTDGPAIEYADGSKEWWFEGTRHRTDGPAIEWANGSKSWWFEGKILTEEEYRKTVSKPTYDGRVVSIDGVEYTLKEVK